MMTGNPTPNVTWYKDDVDLRENTSVLVKNLHLEDEGNYTCQVCNEMGCVYRSYIVNVFGKVPTHNINILTTKIFIYILNIL